MNRWKWSGNLGRVLWSITRLLVFGPPGGRNPFCRFWPIKFVAPSAEKLIHWLNFTKQLPFCSSRPFASSKQNRPTIDLRYIRSTTGQFSVENAPSATKTACFAQFLSSKLFQGTFWIFRTAKWNLAVCRYYSIFPYIQHFQTRKRISPENFFNSLT